MKKIFYWSPHLSNVATIKNVINSAKSIKLFSKNSHNISIIDTIGEWQDQKKILNIYNINLIKLSNLNLNKYLPITGFIKSRFFSLLIILTKFIPLKKLLKKENPEYLILHLVTSLPLIILLLFKTNTKFVLRISGLPKLSMLRRILWKVISKKLYLVTCPSDQTKIDIVKLNIFSKDKIKVLYDPILEVGQISKNLNENIPEICKNKKYFLNIGRLTKQKNQTLLIDAFPSILKKFNDIHLLILGEGEERENLIKRARLNRIENNIHFLGQINNVYPFIKNSLATISTSLWEDPGAVMVEVSFCKKINIVSNCPNGPAEFLSNGDGGYLYKNNDIKDLVEKMLCFLKDEKDKHYNKIFISKKNSKKYTIFSHYKNLNRLLQIG